MTATTLMIMEMNMMIYLSIIPAFTSSNNGEVVGKFTIIL